LILENIRPQTLAYYALVRLQDIVAYPEARVQERLVVLARGVHVLYEAQQAGTIERRKPTLDIAPGGIGCLFHRYEDCESNYSVTGVTAVEPIYVRRG
jgi:hypothetical protein